MPGLRDSDNTRRRARLAPAQSAAVVRGPEPGLPVRRMPRGSARAQDRTGLVDLATVARGRTVRVRTVALRLTIGLAVGGVLVFTFHRLVPFVGLHLSRPLWLVLAGAMAALGLGAAVVALAAWRRDLAVVLLIRPLDALLRGRARDHIEPFITGFIDTLVALIRRPRILL